MRHFKKKTVTVLDNITCDICGEDTVWQGYESSEVVIEAEKGTKFPEGDMTTIIWIDICFKCFEEKIKPEIEKHVKFNVRDNF